ncbi:MAG: phosphopantetheine-binding protein [Thermodesulfobacteriota bacterium]
MEDLILKLKKEIIEELNVENMTPEEIDSEAPLFGEGLGLDSIDALELVVLLDKNYGIKIQASKEGPKIFRSVKTIAEYILEHQKK